MSIESIRAAGSRVPANYSKAPESHKSEPTPTSTANTIRASYSDADKRAAATFNLLSVVKLYNKSLPESLPQHTESPAQKSPSIDHLWDDGYKWESYSNC